MQASWPTQATHYCNGRSFWNGIFAFKEYCSFWFEMWQLACQLERSFTTYLQGNLNLSLSLSWLNSKLPTPQHLRGRDILPTCKAVGKCISLVALNVPPMSLPPPPSSESSKSSFGQVLLIVQVGDFGLSKIKRNTLVTGGVRGTLPWMAPELLNGSSSKVSEKVR